MWTLNCRASHTLICHQAHMGRVTFHEVKQMLGLLMEAAAAACCTQQQLVKCVQGFGAPHPTPSGEGGGGVWGGVYAPHGSNKA